jgi:hypothetical protein
VGYDERLTARALLSDFDFTCHDDEEGWRARSCLYQNLTERDRPSPPMCRDSRKLPLRQSREHPFRIRWAA